MAFADKLVNELQRRRQSLIDEGGDLNTEIESLRQRRDEVVARRAELQQEAVEIQAVIDTLTGG